MRQAVWTPNGFAVSVTTADGTPYELLLGDLIGIRGAFLSRTAVRNAYLGYATQQFKRLENRGDGSFSADTRKRTAKHARHLLRLLTQGLELYETGALTVRLQNPDHSRDCGERVAAGDIEAAQKEIGSAERWFNSAESPLSERPDEAAVEFWLQMVRRKHYGHYEMRAS